MSGLDDILGPLLGGTYANTILYTLEGVALIQYSSSSKRRQDSPLFQSVVYFMFAVDTVCTIAAHACVYLYSVTHWGDTDYLSKQHPPIIVVSGTSGVTEAIVQFFLIYRFWRMSQNNYLTIFMILLCLGSLGGWVAIVIAVTSYLNTLDMNEVTTTVKIWFSLSVTGDLVITLALLWQLNQIKSPLRATQSLIHRLMVSTISTGAVTSVFAVVIMITYLINPNSNVSTGLTICIGRIYALTMLFNLNNRASLQQRSGTDAGRTTNIPTELYMSSSHQATNVGHESSTGYGTLDVSAPSKDSSESFRARGKVSLLPPEP